MLTPHLQNFDYARSLLLTVSSTKQLPKDDVQRKRELVKRLQAQLNELDQLYAHDEEVEDEDSSDEEEAKTRPQIASLSQDTEGIRQRTTTSTTQPPNPQQYQADSQFD